MKMDYPRMRSPLLFWQLHSRSGVHKGRKHSNAQKAERHPTPCPNPLGMTTHLS